jgi:hypothetical protein
VFFAGTAGSVPTARRGLPAILLRAGGDRILVDCGEGTRGSSSARSACASWTRSSSRTTTSTAVCAREGGVACNGAGRFWEDFLTIRDLSPRSDQ